MELKKGNVTLTATCHSHYSHNQFFHGDYRDVACSRWVRNVVQPSQQGVWMPFVLTEWLLINLTSFSVCSPTSPETMPKPRSLASWLRRTHWGVSWWSSRKPSSSFRQSGALETNCGDPMYVFFKTHKWPNTVHTHTSTIDAEITLSIPLGWNWRRSAGRAQLPALKNVCFQFDEDYGAWMHLTPCPWVCVLQKYVTVWDRFLFKKKMC